MALLSHSLVISALLVWLCSADGPELTTPVEITISIEATRPTILSTSPHSPSTNEPTTLQTPPSTPTSQPITGPGTTPLICRNGGTSNGTHCICVFGFSGAFCQFIETFEPATLHRSLSVDMVINEEFNEKYKDKNSPEYKHFVGNFTQKMGKYYHGKEISHFEKVRVTTVRPLDNTMAKMKLSSETLATFSFTPSAKGVKVTHNVDLVIPNNGSSDMLYETNFKEVQTAAKDLTGCTKECPYNVTADPTVAQMVVDVESVCAAKDPVLILYYKLVDVGGTHTCVTVCNSTHPHPKTCFNKGLCRVRRDTGPLCECQSVDSTWYLGNDCRFPIQITPFCIGLSVALACLLVTVVILTAYVLMNKYKQTQTEDTKESLVDQWVNEDCKWSRANSSTFSTHNTGGNKCRKT